MMTPIENLKALYAAFDRIDLICRQLNAEFWLLPWWAIVRQRKNIAAGQKMLNALDYIYATIIELCNEEVTQ